MKILAFHFCLYGQAHPAVPQTRRCMVEIDLHRGGGLLIQYPGDCCSDRRLIVVKISMMAGLRMVGSIGIGIGCLDLICLAGTKQR